MRIILRMSSTDEPCPPKPEPCPPQPPKLDGVCFQPPPCPPLPSFPSTLCPPNPDPNNPCNYCPPCSDSEPDLTKLKKLQCKFQEDNDLPVFLKGGKFDVYLYHATVILTFIGLLNSCYALYKLGSK